MFDVRKYAGLARQVVVEGLELTVEARSVQTVVIN